MTVPSIVRSAKCVGEQGRPKVAQPGDRPQQVPPGQGRLIV
ncbi:MAG TPA: hypothetical protein VF177_04385 [Anaerolineae bacterium]